MLNSLLLMFMVLAIALPHGAAAESVSERTGWAVHNSDKTYDQLVRDVIAATRDKGLFVVTQAGPTKAAAARGVTIPGNRVIGVFNNDFAVQILNLSTAAMIEAPIRLYVTENSDGTATLSYKTAAYVFAPYQDEGGGALIVIAAKLDQRLDEIAQKAIQSAP
ncbi:DUF302 domain-containing protein [Phaeobacter porticola]|nr:DUF302 domain-containing protein [Phaeobacter porticola]